MVQRMPLPLSNIQIGFTFLVPAHPGSPGKRAVNRVCVCVQCVRKIIWPVKMSDEVLMWLSVERVEIVCIWSS